MSLSARTLLTASAVIITAAFAIAAVLSSAIGEVATQPRPDPHSAAHSPAPVHVSPAPVAFDLESDNPAAR